MGELIITAVGGGRKRVQSTPLSGLGFFFRSWRRGGGQCLRRKDCGADAEGASVSMCERISTAVCGERQRVQSTRLFYPSDAADDRRSGGVECRRRNDCGPDAEGASVSMCERISTAVCVVRQRVQGHGSSLPPAAAT